MKVFRILSAVAVFVMMGTLPAATVVRAGQADVLAVKAGRNADGTYDFRVTVRHADKGWNHYADRWEVLAPDGTVLAARILYHPHVGEQPFTRGLSAVKIPAGIKRVTVRAHDSVHGYGGKTVTVRLP